MRIALFSVLVALAAIPLQAQGGDGPPGGGRPDGPPRGERGGRRERPRLELQNFTFREVEFPSANLNGEDGRCGVYLPKGFDDAANKDRTWPLVVWLHGFGGYFEFQGRGGAKVLDELRGKNEIPEVVFVAFQAPGARRGRTVYINGERGNNVEDAIATDLVGYAVKELHASPKASQHAVMGISIGGYGALKLALKHPDVFGVVAAHSSAVFPDDPNDLPPEYENQVGRALTSGLDKVFGNPIDKAKWAAEMPMGLVRNAKDGAFADLRIYFDAGTEDRYGFAEPNEELSKLMDEKKVAHTFRLVEGGEHAWGGDTMLDNLRTSLRFVAAALAPPAKAAAETSAGSDGK